MAGMTRGTRGICTGGGAVLALVTLVGCAQSGQSNQQATQPAAQPVQAAANAAGSVVNAATGAVTGAVNGAVAGASGQTTKPPKPRAKPNGRGGFDSSELQRDASRRAHMTSARYGVTKTTRARNGILAGSPNTPVTSSSSGR